MFTQRKFELAGLLTALSNPLFLGVAPIFGKLALTAGADSFSVAALRTVVSVVILWAVYALFFRKYLFIYPAGLLGCVVIGVINGIGSLFYYGGLGLLDASLVQLLNGLYLVFAVLLTRTVGQPTDARTLLRVSLALLALVMITGLGDKPVDWLGVGLMLGSALMFAGTLILSQYVLYEMPPPTVTVYVLTTMAVVVVMVWVAVGGALMLPMLQAAAVPIIALGITTVLSRLALFSGIKFLGSMQTAALAVMEIGVALALAFVVLGERLTFEQWVGVAILGASLLLIRASDLHPRGINPNALLVANMASVQFQRIAFHRAFGTHEQDNEAQVMASLTTQEMRVIRDMMGAQSKPIDPFPIGKEQAYSVDLSAFLPKPPPEELEEGAEE